MRIIIFGYVIFLILAFFFPRKKLNYYFWLITIFFTVLSFYIIPNSEMDLFRYHSWINEFRLYGMSYFSNSMYGESSPLSAIFLFLVSLTPWNGLFQSAGIFLIYGLSLRIIYKYSIKFNISKQGMLVALLYFVGVTSFFMISSTIRSALAFALFAFFLYSEIIENMNKWLCWIIYILLLGLHSSVIILLILRIVLEIVEKSQKISMISLVLLLFWQDLIPFIYKFLSSFSNGVLQGISLRVLLYKGLYYNTASNMQGLIVVVGLLIVFLIYRYVSTDNEEKVIKYNRFIFIMLVFLLGAYSITDIFTRIAMYLSFFGTPLVLSLYRNNMLVKSKFCPEKRRVIITILILIVIMISIISLFFVTKYHYKQLVFGF